MNDDNEFTMGISLTPNVNLKGNKGAKKKEGSNGGVDVKIYSEFY